MYSISSISKLSDKQLTELWLEIVRVSGDIANGSISEKYSWILTYPLVHFMMYTNVVLIELRSRNINLLSEMYVILSDNQRKGVNCFADDEGFVKMHSQDDIFIGADLKEVE